LTTVYGYAEVSFFICSDVGITTKDKATGRPLLIYFRYAGGVMSLTDITFTQQSKLQPL
jgi:hypothetical protein